MGTSNLISAIAFAALLFGIFVLVWFPQQKTESGLALLASDKEQAPAGLAVLPSMEKDCIDFADFEFVSVAQDSEENSVEFRFRNKLNETIAIQGVSFGQGFSNLGAMQGKENGFPIIAAPLEEFSIKANGALDRSQSGLITIAYFEGNSTIYNLDQTTCFSSP